jgi:hypothetical protein
VSWRWGPEILCYSSQAHAPGDPGHRTVPCPPRASCPTSARRPSAACALRSPCSAVQSPARFPHEPWEGAPAPTPAPEQGAGRAGRKVCSREMPGSQQLGTPRPQPGRGQHAGAERTSSHSPFPGAPRPPHQPRSQLRPTAPSLRPPPRARPAALTSPWAACRGRRAAARVPGRRPRCARPGAALCLRPSLLPPPGGRCRPGRTPPARAPRASQPPSLPRRPLGPSMTIPAAAAATTTTKTTKTTLCRRTAPASSALSLSSRAPPRPRRVAAQVPAQTGTRGAGAETHLGAPRRRRRAPRPGPGTRTRSASRFRNAPPRGRLADRAWRGGLVPSLDLPARGVGRGRVGDASENAGINFQPLGTASGLASSFLFDFLITTA